jgi:hypothetical protein
MGVVSLKKLHAEPLAQLEIDCARHLSKALAAMSTARQCRPGAKDGLGGAWVVRKTRFRIQDDCTESA